MIIFNSHHRMWFIWIFVLVATLLLGGRLLGTGKWNWFGLQLMKGQEISIPGTSSDCPHIWLVARSATIRGDMLARRQAYKQAINCSPANLYVVQSFFPSDLNLAQQAAKDYPQSPEAWFWVGNAVVPANIIVSHDTADLLIAQQAYQKTVELAPRYGLAWCGLGLSSRLMDEWEKASQAYLTCCLNGDPGKFGCEGAGYVMEQLGNLQQAIIYYRLSSYQRALERAKVLEEQLSINR
jgi:tetratricopeptide (TPR) repeat protein